MKTPLVFSMGPKGDEIARHVAQLLASPVHMCGTGREDAAVLVSKAYAARTPIIGVCAAGVLIRLIGTDIGEKVSEPPVVAVSADGKMAVPLLGSHRGANALARWIAEGFRGTAAITSFSDTLYDFALDDLPPGYVLANPQALRPVMAALLNGEKLCVSGPSGWLSLAGYPVDPKGSQKLIITEKICAGPELVIHPQNLVVGLGFASSATPTEVVELIEQALASENLSPAAISALATLDGLADHPALQAAAERFSRPIRVFSKRMLVSEQKRLATPSASVEDKTGLAGICEAIALKAGAILVPKQRSSYATCAIGRADTPILPDQFGKPA